MAIAKIQIFGTYIQIDYVDGSREEIQGGQYTQKDANGNRIERHDATAADIARLYGLADAFVIAVTPGDDVAIRSYDHTATDLQVRYFGGQALSVEFGVIQIKNAQNVTIFERTATQADTDTLLALIDDFLFGVQPGQTFTGTDLADRIRGGAGDDLMSGLGGDDELRGGRGDDTQYGGADNDKLRGDAGNDSLFGGDGDDEMRGDGDLITVGGVGGDDVMDGGAGSDKMRGEGGNDTVMGGDGDDVRVRGDQGDDQVFGNAGNDLVRGDSGNDRVFGGDGIDRVRGDDGDDTVWGELGDDRVDGGNGTDILFGGDGNDRVKGDSGDDQVSGDNGDDRVDGNDGHDLLFGGAGNDDLRGDTGDDTLDGGAGIDHYRGDLGADVLIFAVDGVLDVIHDFEDGLDIIDVSAFGVVDFATMMLGATEHVDANGTDVFLDLGGGDIIKIGNVSLAQLTQADFLL